MRKKNRKLVHLKLIFTYLHKNLFNTSKHLASVLKKFIHVFCVFQTNLDKTVKISYTLREWIRNKHLIQCFSTLKTLMQILHD